MATGSGIGKILGGLAGSSFGPGGSAIGSGIFGTIGSIIDKNNAPEIDIAPTGSTALAHEANVNALTSAQTQRGMSSGTVQRANESASRGDLNKTKAIDTMIEQPGMSSLAQEQMSKALIREITSNQNRVDDRIMDGDIQAEKNRITQIGNASSKVIASGKQVQEETDKAQAEADQNEQNLAKSLVSGMSSVGSGFKFGEEFGFGKLGDAMKPKGEEYEQDPFGDVASQESDAIIASWGKEDAKRRKASEAIADEAIADIDKWDKEDKIAQNKAEMQDIIDNGHQSDFRSYADMHWEDSNRIADEALGSERKKAEMQDIIDNGHQSDFRSYADMHWEDSNKIADEALDDTFELTSQGYQGMELEELSDDYLF